LFVLYTCILAAHLYGVSQLVKSGSYHTLVRFTTLGFVLLYFATFFYMIHYSVYADNGIGSPGLEGFALFLTMLSQLVFMFLCILISKGWTITTNHLAQSLAIKSVMLVLLVLYIALFIWDYVGRDPASTIYFWDSPVGYIIVVVRVGIMVWFMWSILETYRMEEEALKRKFYVIFGSLAAWWFALLPFFVLVALGISDWNRFRTVSGITLFIDSVGLVVLVGLFWPTRIENFFTVHPTPLKATMLGGKTADTAAGNYDSL